MNNLTKTLGAIFGLAVLAGGVMIGSPPNQALVPTQSTPDTPPMAQTVAPQTQTATPASTPAIQYPIEATSTPSSPLLTPLPDLNTSDSHVRRALAGLIAEHDMLKYLQLGQFIRHMVATVDNLPREKTSAVVWPVNPMPGQFSTGDGESRNPLGPTTINPTNDARYTPFVTFVTAVNTASAVAMYVQLYPLFQQAYRELGYPKGYFNDRLIAVIDHLLEAPVQTDPVLVSRVEVKGPYQPVRPWVTYEFTDPALRAMSSGQKMLLRAGAANHQRLRAKLIDIRSHLTRTAIPGSVRSEPQ